MVEDYGLRPGEYLEVEQLATAMEEKIPEDLVVALRRDRDRYLSTLTGEDVRSELIASAWRSR